MRMRSRVGEEYGDMHVQTIGESAVNERGGQSSYLLLDRGQFGARNLSITWVDCVPGSEQPLHAHEASEQVYVIVRGCGLMRAGDEECEVGEGAMIFVPPRTDHAIRNTGTEPLVYVSATSPPFDTPTLDARFAYIPQR